MLRGEMRSAGHANSEVDIYYWDGVNITWESRRNGSSQAVIADPDNKTPLLTGVSGFLDEYSFLRSDVKARGTSSWLASDLARWRSLWEEAGRHLIANSVKHVRRDVIEAQFDWPWGMAVVTFEIREGALFPVRTRLVGTGNVPILDTEVLSSSRDEETGLLFATKAKASVAKLKRDGTSVVVGTVTEVFEKREFNPEIDDGAFKCDPASVDEIIDHGVFIKVPK